MWSLVVSVVSLVVAWVFSAVVVLAVLWSVVAVRARVRRRRWWRAHHRIPIPTPQDSRGRPNSPRR
jgi:hypothetical protein